jgi:hypothetical protein
MGNRGAKPTALYPRAPGMPQKSYLSDTRGHGASNANPAPDLRFLYRHPAGFMDAQRSAPKPRDRLAAAAAVSDQRHGSRLTPHTLSQPLLVVVAKHREQQSGAGVGSAEESSLYLGGGGAGDDEGRAGDGSGGGGGGGIRGRVGTFHVVILQSKHQVMTAGTFHVTNLTPPGSGSDHQNTSI